MTHATNVTFKRTMSLNDMLTESRVNDSGLRYLFEGIPVQGADAVAMPHLHDFGRPTDSAKAVNELRQLGLRPATFAELLLFGANSSEEEDLPMIAGLDERRVFRYDGIRYVPLLNVRDRRLSAEAWIDVGGTHFRFAVVPV